MKRSFGLILTLASLIIFTGCQQQQNIDNAAKIVPGTKLHNAVTKCIKSSKCNAKEWSFDADAIATIFEDECKTLIAQRHLFNCDSGKTDISIDSFRAGGKVSETLKANDKLDISGKLCPNNSSSCSAARLKLYSIALSSMHTLLNDDKLDMKYVAMEDKGGRCCHIIEVKGNILSCCRDKKIFDNSRPTDIVRVWIDNNTGHIKRIWINYLKSESTNEHGYIIANVSNYLLQKNGMKLPTSIEFVPSDNQANDSGQSILKIDFKRFRFADEKLSASAI